uniref:T-complex protein 1 subunit alpha n=1 Tax=Papio anubis TaxID=9555 RepID=A0A2I3MP25_PAPAN
MEGPLSVFGDRSTGEAIRSQNVMTAASIANIVKSSLGPVGLDKMLVDDTGDVTIANDGAPILKLLEVEHPAAKVLCELADLQDKEVGDGTTSVPFPYTLKIMQPAWGLGNRLLLQSLQDHFLLFLIHWQLMLPRTLQIWMQN